MEVKSKAWFESVSVWGIVITVLASLLGLIGVNIGPDQTQAAIDIVPKALEALDTKNWVGLISVIVSLAGSIMATVGRTQATQPIHFAKEFNTKVDANTVTDVAGPPDDKK